MAEGDVEGGVGVAGGVGYGGGPVGVVEGVDADCGGVGEEDAVEWGVGLRVGGLVEWLCLWVIGGGGGG